MVLLPSCLDIELSIEDSDAKVGGHDVFENIEPYSLLA